MKKALRILGIVLGVIILLIGVAAIYNSQAALPIYQVEIPDVQVPLDSNRIARGAKIVKGTCTFCHQGDNGRLDGRILVDDPAFGKIFSSNITQDKAVGIGSHTDGELVRLLRTGIKKNNKLVVPMMAKMPHLSDEDVYSIIAYLRSDAPALAATPTKRPEPAMGFVGKALFRLVFKPLPMPTSPMPHPDTKDQVAYGKYLMTDAMECANCHSASFETYNVVNPEQSEGYLGGGNLVELPGLGKLLSPNITMHPEKGIGKMTVEEFIQTVKYRQHRTGRELNPIMPSYDSYSEEDIRAVWEYIQTVPVSDNDVSALAEKLATN